MAKFKILKVSKIVGSGSLAVGPSMSKLEADEFAKVNAELVEVGETDKATSRQPSKMRIAALRRRPVYRCDIESRAEMCRCVIPDCWLRCHRHESGNRK